MEHSRPPTYAAKNSQEDYGTSGTQGDDVESSSSGTYSVAASPYWKGPIEKAAKSSPKSSTGFSPAVAFCFTINYILGAGFLTIPWAFVQSGLVLSSVMLLVSALGSDIAKDLYVILWACSMYIYLCRRENFRQSIVTEINWWRH